MWEVVENQETQVKTLWMDVLNGTYHSDLMNDTCAIFALYNADSDSYSNFASLENADCQVVDYFDAEQNIIGFSVSAPGLNDTEIAEIRDTAEPDVYYYYPFENHFYPHQTPSCPDEGEEPE
eukprot:TRINITY_DN84606_c0_g1_i1.p1 TRINITY_DN84606_c0_g1~~TRINITY_DN84606_c0_g1_i1.p1  ORF type:complete len:122 (+),score=15.95 TRINITY_DN84606_c0_g1_i1:72-437(+)